MEERGNEMDERLLLVHRVSAYLPCRVSTVECPYLFAGRCNVADGPLAISLQANLPDACAALMNCPIGSESSPSTMDCLSTCDFCEQAALVAAAHASLNPVNTSNSVEATLSNATKSNVASTSLPFLTTMSKQRSTL